MERSLAFIRKYKLFVGLGLALILGAIVTYFIIPKIGADTFDPSIIDGSVTPETIDVKQGQIATLTFVVKKTTRVNISAKDSSGNPVKTIYTAGRKKPGTYTTTWNGTDSSGVTKVPTGTYSIIFTAVSYARYDQADLNILNGSGLALQITSISPNPFDPAATGTSITWVSPLASRYRLYLEDLNGTEITRIVDYSSVVGEKISPWNGKKADGSAVPYGSYRIVVAEDIASPTVTPARGDVTLTQSQTPPPTVSLTQNNSSIAENAGTSIVTATLSAAYTQTVTVNLAFSGTATNATDYTRSSASIAIGAGSTTGTITLTAVQDTSVEGNETIITDIDSVTNGTESGTQQLITTITDDDTTPPSDQTAFYGGGINGNGLANLEIGKETGRQISYRFKATKSASAKEVRVYLRFLSDTAICPTCYSSGNGGHVKVELKKDDGTSNHWPSTASDAVLASSTITDPKAQGTFRTFVFNQTASLTKDQLYHLVFTNPYTGTGGPIDNFVSINNLDVEGISPMQPTYSSTDLAVAWKTSGSTGWAVNVKRTPIFSLNFTDGSSQGQGYIDHPSSLSRTVGGANKIREKFTVTGGNRTISKAAIRFEGGSGTVSVRLETSGGTEIKTATATAGANGWVTADLGTQTLTNGSSYNLVFSSTGSYTAIPLQKGNSTQWQLGDGTVFADGWAQSTSGTTWASVGGDDYADFQFYMQ